MTDGDSADLLKKKKGRKAFAPTDAQRADVSRMVGEQLGVDAIAAAVGVSEPTLRKHFAAELGDRLAGGPNLFAAAAEPAPAAPAPAKADGRGKGGGRPRFRPNDSQRARVMEMVAVGSMDEAAIARAIGISAPVYRRAFRAEIASGRQVKKAEVVEQLFRAGRKGSVPALARLLDMMERAELADMDKRMTGRPTVDEKAPRRSVEAEPGGKKVEAELAAHEAVKSGPWSDLLGPAADLNGRPH